MDATGQVHGGGARCASRGSVRGRQNEGRQRHIHGLSGGPMHLTSDGDGGRRRCCWRPAAQMEIRAWRHVLGRSGTDGGGCLTGLTESDGGSSVQNAQVRVGGVAGAYVQNVPASAYSLWMKIL